MKSSQAIWMPKSFCRTHSTARWHVRLCVAPRQGIKRVSSHLWTKTLSFPSICDVMLNKLPSDNPRVDIRYRYDGGLFKSASLKSPNFVNFQHTITELQYADDNAAFCHAK